MNTLEGILEDVQRADMDFILKGLKPLDDVTKAVENYANKILSLFKEYQETGKLPAIDENSPIWEACVSNAPNLLNGSYIKENIQPRESDSLPKTRGRPRRNVLKENSQQINKTNNSTLKPRQPTSNADVLQNIQIKTEKLSINETGKPDLEQLDVLSNVRVKSEVDEMPAPTRPAPRRKKKIETIQIKQEIMNKTELKPRDSDVIVQDTAVTVINLEDSADEISETLVEKPKKRATRTKGAQKKMKRSRTHSCEDEIQGSSEKKAKSCEKDEENEDNRKYKDPPSNLEANKDATFISKSTDETNTQQNLNATVVIENPKLIQNLVPKSIEDMMTDDESEEEVKTKKPLKSIRAIPKATKQIFSPFEQSPVKKKVQAFEKLKEEANPLPPRMTRTKTRAKAKECEGEEETTETEPKEIKSNTVKEKAKLFTPLSSKCLPLAASTSVKPNRVIPSNSNESLLSNKSVSALKASQAEYREREKKRREREQDALKKREALMQAKIEEQKRKREEKQLKAQQQREVLEKEKLKLLEAQKLKDERHRHLLAEQEEKKLKQKEEQEKKRLLAKMRALDEKQKSEERKKKEEDRKNEEERRAKFQKEPIYMKMKPPLLPTDDCYDSDDDNYGNATFIAQQWVNSKELKFMQKCASVAGEAVKNTFFSTQAQTPDLREIFENIDIRKLKRTSSAVWHKPPRFSMMPGLESFVEDEETGE